MVDFMQTFKDNFPVGKHGNVWAARRYILRQILSILERLHEVEQGPFALVDFHPHQVSHHGRSTD